ncbi:MAG: hypothetical protein J7513_17965 [Solirubrobacteraceae bacterium]|nr:hypothetical protein [Solirubrobacteraceae bacterium]
MKPARPLALAAVLAATGVAASSASAATLALDRACYVDGGSGGQTPINATAGGLAPGQTYNIGFTSKGSSGETGYAYGTADASGALGFAMSSWYGGSTFKAQTYKATVVLRDSANNVLASADTKTSSLQIDVTGSGKYRKWKVTGLAALTGGTTYYAHYFNNNKYKGRLKIGKASGPCGVYTGKRPLTPFSKLGRYDVKVTTTKKWAAGDAFIGGRIVVTKRYR